MAMPATGALKGTPPSIGASEDAQMDACEVEPFEAIDSETIRIVYGNSETEGKTIASAFSASAPCPISRRFVNPDLPTSPEE
jgi:hypothetical protein